MPQFLLQRNDALPEGRNGVTTIGIEFLNCCCSYMIVRREAFQRILENTHTINALNCVGARTHVGLMEIIYKTISIRPSISGENTHTPIRLLFGHTAHYSSRQVEVFGSLCSRGCWIDHLMTSRYQMRNVGLLWSLTGGLV